MHRSNKGSGGARNTGMAVAVGEYMGFVDSDDYIHPDMYKTMYGLAIKNDEIDIVQCAVSFVRRKSVFVNVDKNTLSNGSLDLFFIINISIHHPWHAKYLSVVCTQSTEFLLRKVYSMRMRYMCFKRYITRKKHFSSQMSFITM